MHPSGAIRAMLPDGRRAHFQHGPIDLVLEAFGAPDEVARAYEQAWRRFETILPELVAELPILRRAVSNAACPLGGGVAQRMWRACVPFAETFITPMAAVAGAVADETLAAMIDGRTLQRAYVNDGGDISLHLAPGEKFDTGIVTDLARPAIDGVISIGHHDQIRGIATSGWKGRSFSLGIVDAVTVLAKDAATADAAAKPIANAVTIEDPSILRAPAASQDPDSDLGDRPVTLRVGRLAPAQIEAALAKGAAKANELLARGLIRGALLALQGVHTIVGQAHGALPARAQQHAMGNAA
ncbi:MAG: UPF0280 family protein [Alphaproteobacteria bacterium]